MYQTASLLQPIALELAGEVISICDRFGLRYYLAEGSLLGAVRHQGFIPWDDDIDLALPREDYDRLLALLPRELSPGYRLVEFRTAEHHLRFFAQVEKTSAAVCEDAFVVPFRRGMWIDLFPLDGMPQKRAARGMHLARLLWLRAWAQVARADECVNIRRSHPRMRRLFVRACMACAKLCHADPRKRLMRYENAARRYRAEDTGWTISIGSLYKGRTIFPASFYGEGKPRPFEGKRWNTPEEAERILTALYGDYMALPPPEKRVGHRLKLITQEEKEGCQS